MTDDNRVEQIINDVEAVFDRHTETLAAYEETLALLCDEAHWAYAEIWTPEELDRLSCLTCHWVDDQYEEFVAITRVVRFDYGEGLPGQIWESGEPEIIENLAVVPSFEFARASNASFVGLRHAYGVPIFHEERVIGVLAVAAPDEVESEHQHRITDGFAQALGTYLDQSLEQSD